MLPTIPRAEPENLRLHCTFSNSALGRFNRAPKSSIERDEIKGRERQFKSIS